jgi:Zn-dependent protease
MASSLRLFKIFGISVELHWTFFLIFLIVIPEGLGGLLFFLLLFILVLIHELCHSLMAKNFGVKVQRITLTPLGGIASLEIPEDPKKEFLISLAGPMSNFVMMFLVLLLAFFLNFPLNSFIDSIVPSLVRFSILISNPSTLAEVLLVLFQVNLLLGAFNILPGFPMDGGRILRSLLAFKLEYIKATEIAVQIGRIAAIFFIIAGLGIFDVLVGTDYASLWLIIIGLFLIFAGGQELEVLKVRHYLRGLTVGKIASPPPRYAMDSMSLKDFMTTVATREQIHYPVIDSEHRIIGVLNLSDLRNVSEADYPVATVKDLARHNISVVEAGMNVENNLQFLLSKEYFFVEDQGRVVGYLTPNIVLEAARFYGITKKE